MSPSLPAASSSRLSAPPSNTCTGNVEETGEEGGDDNEDMRTTTETNCRLIECANSCVRRSDEDDREPASPSNNIDDGEGEPWQAGRDLISPNRLTRTDRFQIAT